MELQELSGINTSNIKSDLISELNENFSLSGIESDDDILEGSFLSGLGEVDSEDEADAKAQTLKKKHPNTKYSTLLKKASKLI
jgi:hypothetical protein